MESALNRLSEAKETTWQDAVQTVRNAAALALIDDVVAMSEKNRGYRRHNSGEWAFAYNVKVHGADETGKSGECPVNPELETAWARHVDAHPELFYLACEDAGSYFADGLWTTTPGDDQGDWKFSFAGSGGGWLVLDSWRYFELHSSGSYDLRDRLEEMLDDDSVDYAWLRDFLRGLAVAEAELTSAAGRAEVSYLLNAMRRQWEEDHELEDADDDES